MRFVAATNHRCSAVSRGYASVTRSSGIPDKRSRDADRPPKTTVAFVRSAQSIPDNRERAVAARACQLLPPVQLLLSTNNHGMIVTWNSEL